ncbi:MAG: hypothetical protein NVSMB64_18910 [Candidatus Velthaea sp.]
MFRRFLTGAASAIAAVLVAGSTVPAHAATSRSFDHVWVIMMENQSFDGVIGRNRVDSNGNLLEADTPYITQLAASQGLATLYFGVTHPSLPNYLTTIAGDYFGVQDDSASCFAQPSPGAGCHRISAPNLVDTLEARHLTWGSLMASMPSDGFLGTQAPSAAPRLYAQKHNPFVYFSDIATNQSRLAKIKPLSDANFSAALAHPANFEYIVPNQCDDMHGTTTCTNTDALLKRGDATVKTLVSAITSSAAFTANSAIFVVWDEDDYSSSYGCCGSAAGLGGGHTLTIVVSKTSAGKRSAVPMNHYSLLKTIEQGFGLPALGHSADPGIATMWDLF